MAEFNSCSHLVDETAKEAAEIYDRLLSEGKDPSQYMLDMQRSLQVQLSYTYPDRAKDPDELKTVGEVYDWVRDQKTAIDDEFSELISAIPGTNLPEKVRTSVWKKWKSGYNDIRNKPMSELTDDETNELLFERIDLTHFEMNIDLALKLTAKQKFIMYVLKNLENVRRYNTGY